MQDGDILRLQPEIDPQYLLASAELKEAFSDWQVLAYREGWEESDSGHPRAVASLVARKPA